MPFDHTKVPPFSKSDEDTFGTKLTRITFGASDQIDASGRYFKYFTVATSGTVTVVGYSNADDEGQEINVQAGQVVPGRIRRITAGTATIDGWSD